ncbi:hypothetical protein [Buttiauxella sp.]|uniref:hypothetical protein n=1 Tax=Buttiauxella sp. TaxID=1972222 RepID=UPI003C742B45
MKAPAAREKYGKHYVREIVDAECPIMGNPFCHYSLHHFYIFLYSKIELVNSNESDTYRFLAGEISDGGYSG